MCLHEDLPSTDDIQVENKPALRGFHAINNLTYEFYSPNAILFAVSELLRVGAAQIVIQHYIKDDNAPVDQEIPVPTI